VRLEIEIRAAHPRVFEGAAVQVLTRPGALLSDARHLGFESVEAALGGSLGGGSTVSVQPSSQQLSVEAHPERASPRQRKAVRLIRSSMSTVSEAPRGPQRFICGRT
jgi:hypothetical protein